jgi:hypothetical protein
MVVAIHVLSSPETFPTCIIITPHPRSLSGIGGFRKRTIPYYSMKTKAPKLTLQQKTQILGEARYLQLPSLNANSQKYQEWLDSSERHGLRLTGRQVTILLDLFESVEDALTCASNTLEQAELLPSAKE